MVFLLHVVFLNWGGGGGLILASLGFKSLYAEHVFTLKFHPYIFALLYQEMTLQHIIADPDVLIREVEAYSSLLDALKDELRSLLSSTNPHLALRHSVPSSKSAALSETLVGHMIGHMILGHNYVYVPVTLWLFIYLEKILFELYT